MQTTARSCGVQPSLKLVCADKSKNGLQSAWLWTEEVRLGRENACKPGLFTPRVGCTSVLTSSRLWLLLGSDVHVCCICVNSIETDPPYVITEESLCKSSLIGVEASSYDKYSVVRRLQISHLIKLDMLSPASCLTAVWRLGIKWNVLHESMHSEHAALIWLNPPSLAVSCSTCWTTSGNQYALLSSFNLPTI